MIKVLNLTKKFNGFTAVDNISFTVKKRETLILLGTSGCGKTTTLKMINRLVESTSGKIFIEGKNTVNYQPEDLRRQIGYVIQNIGLFPHYTVEQNIAVVPGLLKWDKKRQKARVRDLLELVGLPPKDFLKRKPGALSGGQQQRVGLARALAADPSIVLLDEPFGALDPLTRKQIQKVFINLESMLEKTMVLVTHDVFEACELGDRICLMDNGQIKQIGTAKELLFSPRNDFVNNFFQTNRFQLELFVLTLNDLIKELPKTEHKGNAVQGFDKNAKIMHVLEKMGHTSEKNPVLYIKDCNNEKILTTTTGDIMTAFYQKRAKLLQ